MAHRAGYRCSKPDCRILTRGAASDNDGTINIGFAAHITAASPGGPRYNPMLTEAERKHHSNGIWLCGTHAKLVDSDESQFTIEELLKWKRLAERRSFLEVVASKPSPFGALTGDDHVQTAFNLLLDYSKSDLAAFQQSPGWPVHPVTLNLRLLDGESTTTFTASAFLRQSTYIVRLPSSPRPAPARQRPCCNSRKLFSRTLPLWRSLSL